MIKADAFAKVPRPPLWALWHVGKSERSEDD